MSRPRTTLAAAVLGVVSVFAITACTPSPPPPTPTPTPSEAPPSDPVDRYAAPTDPPTGSERGFDDAAEFEDGIFVQLDVEAGQATDEMSGAEGTNGEIVTATIEVINNGSASVDLSGWTVQGYYSADDVGAPLIADEAGTVGDSFDGMLGPGQNATAAFAFAIPKSETGEVTVFIDRGDGINEPIQFTGAAG